MREAIDQFRGTHPMPRIPFEDVAGAALSSVDVVLSRYDSKRKTLLDKL